MENPYPGSRVLIQGQEARLYDLLLDLFTLGFYTPFIKSVIKDINITEDDTILDLGSGTGKNACLMARYLSKRGYILGLDVSDDMISVFNKRCKGIKNISVKKIRIDKPFNLGKQFSKVFISFVLHGFPQDVRMVILKNAFEHLKRDGEFHILDYGEFNLDESSFIFRKFFTMIECKYAFDFIKRDIKDMLQKIGFKDIEESFYIGGKIRLVKAKK